jgi:NTP pyrophosphatase (non-canonical NTP hydrolase)
MELPALQQLMHSLYRDRDMARGTDTTFRWFTEEVGELARAIRKGDRTDLQHEFGDALAWLASLANLEGIDLDQAMARYGDGCPKCHLAPCDCPF